MQLSARGAQKTRDESKKLQMYSKQWSPGETLRVFYPIFWDGGRPEIAVGAIWGHNVSDIKALGLKTAFIPSTTEFDENAMPIGVPDITYQFSQIAKVFVNGQKSVEEAVIMKKNWPNETSRKEALKTLEERFDTKNNTQAVRPIIGRAQYYISTEVLSIKLVNDIPDTETLVLSSAPLSKQTIDKLYLIMDDPKYAPQAGDKFLEVEWKYPTNTDKSKSAKTASPVGLTAEYRLQNRNPEAYNAVAGQFDSVSRESDTIVRRATRAIDPARVKAAITQYAFLNSEYLDAAIDDDVEVLTRHADLVKELDITRVITNEELAAKIEEAIREMEVKRPTVPEEIPTPVAASPAMPEDVASSVASAMQDVPDLTPVAGAPTMQSLLSEESAAPTHVPDAMPNIQSLLNNNNLVNEEQLDMDDIDLAMSV